MSESQPIEIKVNGLAFNFIDPTKSIEAETFCGLGYEPGVCKLIQDITRKLPKDSVFLDIGAHYGFFPVYLSQVSPHINTIAVEPGREQLDVLQKNIDNYTQDTQIVDLAFSDTNTIQSFKGRKFVNVNEEDSYGVKTVLGDEWLEKNKIKPTIIKIDVHGLEIKVLKGLRNSLKNDVKHIILEVHEEKLLQGGDYREIYDLLDESGFLIFEMINFRFSDEISLKMLDESSKQFFINFDFWAKVDKLHEKMLYCIKP